MNTDQTEKTEVSVRVVSYADGVYNLELYHDDVVCNLYVDETDADRVCDLLGTQRPRAEPTSPERWG